MWLGFIIGAIMVLISSIIGETRVMKARQEVSKEVADLVDTVMMKDSEIESQQKQIEELRTGVRELVRGTKDMVKAYNIIVDLLEKEIGREEANRRFEERMNEKPQSLNDFLKKSIDNNKE